MALVAACYSRKLRSLSSKAAQRDRHWHNGFAMDACCRDLRALALLVADPEGIPPLRTHFAADLTAAASAFRLSVQVIGASPSLTSLEAGVQCPKVQRFSRRFAGW